jgi:hypothetical protein
MNIFGFEILRAKKDMESSTAPTVVTPLIEDGAINISAGSHYGIYVDIDGSYRSEIDLVTKYRTMAMQPEIEQAIEDIINESIVHDEKGSSVEIIVDDLEQPEAIKDKIKEEFKNVMRLLDFSNSGIDIFRRWYVDGRLYYNVILDPENPRAGIQSVINIDPRRIRKIRNIKKVRDKATNAEVIENIEEFYIYNEKVLNNTVSNPIIASNYAGGTKLTADSVVHLTSGLFDPARSTVLSYLHKAIRPMNQLRFVEDAIVIYRLSRAPERRVFYVDVGNMPKVKAEQYLRDMMVKYRNKLVYDSATGEIRDDRRQLSMLEDFWMPRRGEGKSTEITTLPAGQNLGELEDVKYFERKLYKSLNVPISRLEAQQGFSLGRASEITRDELKFMRFIEKLRSRFSVLFDDLLARQLSLKGVCTLDEWNDFKQYIHYDFLKDNNFSELKDAELMQNRIAVLNIVDPYVGNYFSKKWIQENVLHFTEDEVQKIDEEIAEEQAQQPQEESPEVAAGGGVSQSEAPEEDQQVDANTSTQDANDINTKIKKLF